MGEIYIPLGMAFIFWLTKMVAACVFIQTHRFKRRAQTWVILVGVLLMLFENHYKQYQYVWGLLWN